MSGPIYRDQAVQTVTIANADTISGAIALKHFVLWGLVLPSISGTSLSFQVSADGVTYQALYDDAGDQVTIPVAAATPRSYTLPAALAAWPWAKIVSNLAEGGERTLTLVAKG